MPTLEERLHRDKLRAAYIQRKFLYCLQPTPSSSGFLTLGVAAGTSSSDVGLRQDADMLRSQDPTFYFVRLEAIRVNGRQLSIPTWVFSSGAMLMDSGTVIMRLPPTAYSALSSAFKAAMMERGYTPARQSGGGLDTCFDVSGQSSVTVPPVALVFSGGAVVDLDAYGILVPAESDSILCLAFTANSDDPSHGTIGNVQQRTFEVLHDVGRGAVGFRAGAC